MANAACALAGTTIRGSVISGWASRAAFTARISDSVPPLVTLPTTSGAALPGPPPSSRAAAPTSAFSIASSDGKAVGSSPLTWALPAYAAAASSSSPGTAGS